ncbi:MAG: hypothetical protein ACK5Z5_05295 [Neisseriaceae bacterium]
MKSNQPTSNKHNQLLESDNKVESAANKSENETDLKGKQNSSNDIPLMVEQDISPGTPTIEQVPQRSQKSNIKKTIVKSGQK